MGNDPLCLWPGQKSQLGLFAGACVGVGRVGVGREGRRGGAAAGACAAARGEVIYHGAVRCGALQVSPLWLLDRSRLQTYRGKGEEATHAAMATDRKSVV